MNITSKTIFALLFGITSVFVTSGAMARARFGLSGPIGVHVGTRSGVGISLPTPQAGVGIDGPYDVSATLDPHGARVHTAGPYGSSASISSDGSFSAGAAQTLPGGVTVSGGVDQNGPSADADYDYSLEPITYAGSF